MEQKRTHLNLKVSPTLKTELERFAAKEKRTVSNLSELLLEWALACLQDAGTTMALLTSAVQKNPSPRQEGMHTMDLKKK